MDCVQCDPVCGKKGEQPWNFLCVVEKEEKDKIARIFSVLAVSVGIRQPAFPELQWFCYDAVSCWDVSTFLPSSVCVPL